MCLKRHAWLAECLPGGDDTVTMDEELQLLDKKVMQLKLDYEQYFLGSRPREPVLLRADAQKQIIRHSNTAIQNTALRFKFNSINSRFQAYKRQWDAILRQIDAGTYKRHVFKANLHDRMRDSGIEGEQAGGGAEGATTPSLFDSYQEAARACGQNVSGLTPEKLEAVIRKQEDALRKQLGCEKVQFRVVVESGKVKLKASAVR
jgi:hypothetical protein